MHKISKPKLEQNNLTNKIIKFEHLIPYKLYLSLRPIFLFYQDLYKSQLEKEEQPLILVAAVWTVRINRLSKQIMEISILLFKKILKELSWLASPI